MILIASADSSLAKHNHLPWMFLGSPAAEAMCERYLDSVQREFIGCELESVADFHRDYFVDYISAISQTQADLALWYSTRVASKSASQTSIFHQYIYLKFIEKLANRKEDVLFVTDDVELIANLRAVKFVHVQILVPVETTTAKRILRLKGWAKVIRYFILWLGSRAMNHVNIRQYDVLLHSWIDERVYQALPAFTDSYLGALEARLAENNLCVGRMAPMNVKIRDLIKLRRYFPNMILPISLISLSDLTRAAGVTLCPISLSNDQDFLRHLVNNEIEKENASKVFLDYWLSYRAYQSLGSYLKKEAAIVYPFENQPWEKMLNLALPNHRRIAYQHSTIAKNWLDYRYSNESGAILPSVLLSSGPVWMDFLKKYFTSIPVENAGTLRFQYLFNRDALPKPKKIIAVALPIHQSLAVSLQKNILASMKVISSMGYQVKIKSHPHLRKDAVLTNEFTLHDNCQFVNESVDQLLNECELLISADSAVLFESVFVGRKTVCFIPESLGFGLEEWIKTDVVKVYQNNFVNGLKNILAAPQPKPVAADKYFSTAKYDVFINHLSQYASSEVVPASMV